MVNFYDNKIPMKFLCKNKNNILQNVKVKNNNKNDIYEDLEVIETDKDKDKGIKVGNSFIEVSSEAIN